ncbi:hypothetical protein QBC35DRAFT_474964 [Podospora australis]|uniref:Nephrocystin 3-like N-terminal domain-containing protein n=1 Tax=Podospora australis TaxID=1536484 RepID=A0AAN6WSW8_9PEZI|nr:hypothetical protein QBC35DRAFT_474964 [Podospora australis]
MDSFHSRLVRVPSQDGNLSSHEKDILDLAKDCREVSATLLHLLRKMKRPESKGLQAAWGTLVASFNNIVHGQEKADLEERLDRCHGRLNVLLTWSMSCTVDKMTDSMEKSDGHLRQIQQSIDELKDLQRSPQTEAWLINLVSEKLQQAVIFKEEVLCNAFHAQVLEALRYDQMRNRGDGLKQQLSLISDRQGENGGTFRWIYDDGPNPTDKPEELEMKQVAREKFANWLTCDGGIFHITGKFGAGKSTLMQFLYDHPQTQARLEEWPGERTLVKVNYFFSTVIGGPQQRLGGLFRTILHDILARYPQMTTENLRAPTCASAFSSTDSMNSGTLMEAIMPISSNYFILGHQQPDRTLNFVWPAERRSHSMRSSLEMTVRIHDLTRYDMERYVEERLRRISDDGIRNELISQIPEKAQGIFLWTHLVVREIREDIDASGGADIDFHTLDRFPSGLKPLLDMTVASITVRYRKKAYLTFAIMSAIVDVDIRLSPVQLSFLSEYLQDPEFGYTIKISGWWARSWDSDAKARYSYDELRTDQAVRQVRAWCKGLVETIYVDEQPVTEKRPGDAVKVLIPWLAFAHRSVSEYFQESSRMQSLSEYFAGVSVSDVVSQLILAELCHTGRQYEWGAALTGYLRHRLMHNIDQPPYSFGESKWKLEECDLFGLFLRASRKHLQTAVAFAPCVSIRLPSGGQVSSLARDLVEIEGTVWQHFIVAEVQLMVRWFSSGRAGQDPWLLISIMDEDPERELRHTRVVRFEFNRGRSSLSVTIHSMKDPYLGGVFPGWFDIGKTYTLIDWIQGMDLLDMPNRDTLLELIDQKLAEHSMAENTTIGRMTQLQIEEGSVAKEGKTDTDGRFDTPERGLEGTNEGSVTIEGKQVGKNLDVEDNTITSKRQSLHISIGHIIAFLVDSFRAYSTFPNGVDGWMVYKCGPHLYEELQNHNNHEVELSRPDLQSS